MDTLYFKSVGIIHETTAPYTPQQNGERGTKCIFVGYAKHSKAFRFFVIESNESVSINSIIESRDVIFDENKFSTVSRPSQRSMVNGTKYFGSSVVPEEVTEEIVQQPEPELRKSKMNRTPKNFGPEFQLYLIKGTRDEKEAINDEMDSIMSNNTLVMADLPTDYFDTYAPVTRISTIRLLIAMASVHNLIIHQMDVKTAFLNGELKEESHYIEKVFKKFNYFECTPVSTLMDTSKKLMPNNGQAVSQLEYSRVIGCLMYAMTCTRPAIAFAVGKLSRYSNGLKGEALLEAKNDADLWEAPLGAVGFSAAEENEKNRKLQVKVEDYKAKRVEAIVGKLADKGDKIRNQISELNLELYRLQTSNNRSFVLPSQVSLLEAVFRNISGVYTTDFLDTPPLVVDYTNISNSFDESGLLFAPKLTSVKRVRFNATANIRKKMTKEERKALIKAGREDSVKYQSKAAVKQKKVHFHISLLFLAFPCIIVSPMDFAFP
ncbi:zinc finger, CCHC-type containing protein [Tanacetum coccineum]